MTFIGGGGALPVPSSFVFEWSKCSDVFFGNRHFVPNSCNVQNYVILSGSTKSTNEKLVFNVFFFDISVSVSLIN